MRERIGGYSKLSQEKDVYAFFVLHTIIRTMNNLLGIYKQQVEKSKWPCTLLNEECKFSFKLCMV